MNKCYTIGIIPGRRNEDRVGYREDFFRVLEYGKYGKLLPPNSGSMNSNKGETKAEFLGRVKKSDRYRDEESSNMA